VAESELLYDWQFTANQFVLATSPFRLMKSNFIFQLNTCGYSPYVTSSVTREWVCRLQLLLVLASVVVLRYESRGLMIFYCLTFETPPTWTARPPYLYPHGTGWPGYTPRHWDPFSSPPTTQRIRVNFTTGVYRQSVRLGDNLLRLTTSNFIFPTKHLRL
jgi:hypothetical protein